MAMGTRKQREKQEGLWIAHTELATAPGHPFYQKLNELLEAERFDEFVEERCAKFYAAKYGRPSLTPGIYFRSLLIGYFEGIGAERGIAWRLADSLALRRFVGIALDEYTPDHSTISRTRRLIDLDTHREVFGWVLGVLADRGLLKGKRIAIDATTLEANAAMRSIVRRDTGESYEEFLRGLAKASGIATPTPRRPGTTGPQAQEAHVEQGVEESGGRGCADREDERRAHALGAQGRARGRSGHGRGGGGDAARGRPGRHDDAGRDVVRGGHGGGGADRARSRVAARR